MSVDLLKDLNLEQKKAVVHEHGPLLIVAGAGTGKTTVVTRRIAWLIETKRAKPENILALTFTDKAAAEMEERVDLLLPYGYVDLQVSTFHSFCEHLLRQYGVEIGLSRDFKLANELDSWLLTRKHFDEFELDHYRPLGNPTKYIKSILTHFSRAKDSAITPDQYLDFVEEQKLNLDSAQGDDNATSEVKRLEELAKAYQTYQQVLSENDYLDFGDLLLYTLELLKKRPKVLSELQEQYTHILVDEFQDTNAAQYEIVKLLAAPKNNLTVVGDDDQSIYQFRGASLANILRFKTDYPDASQVVLVDNYRSVQGILDHAYEFIQQNNPNRLEVQGESRISKKLKANCEGHGSIEHIHCATLDDEIKTVWEKIAAIKQKDSDISWNDFAILVRSNNAGTAFASALDQQKIPFQFLALSGLYRTKPVLDLIAFFRVIDNPNESPSLYRLFTLPMYQIPATDLAELMHLARRKGKSLSQACQIGKSLLSFEQSTWAKIDLLMNHIAQFRDLAAHKRVSELLLIVAKDSGYLECVNQLDEQDKIDSFSHMQQLYERAKSFEKRADHPVLHHFLNEFQHEIDAGEEGSLHVDLDAGPELVRIMTIHAAKGLEFKYVFVVNMVSQRFPTRERKDAIPLPIGLVDEVFKEGQTHLEEERRLFYVAMTRAKNELYFTSADDYGGARTRKLSRFLDELGYEKTETKAIIQIFDEDQNEPVVPEVSVQYKIPKQFSFTQLAAFKTCPLQYKFAHVLKIPVMGKWTFSFGKSMHNTLHRFFEVWLERTALKQTTLFSQPGSDPVAKNGPISLPGCDPVPVGLDELLEMYVNAWQDDWYTDDKQREEYRKQGEQSLRDYYKIIQDEQPKPFALEKGFTLKFNDLIIKGRIDRIDTFEDGFEIIDYKTGKSKLDKDLKKTDKEQLFLYQLAAKEILGLKPKKLTFHYLENNSTVSFLATDEELSELKASVTKRVEGIRSSEFHPTPGFHCKFCDFKDICEFAQS